MSPTVASPYATGGLSMAPSASPSASSGGGIGGFLSRALPTIGSIALPLIADFATGGLATPLDVGLAGLGGALGKGAENLTQGQSPFQASDITAGAEGALGQAGGALVGKYALSPLAGLASRGADTLAAKSAASQFGDQALQDAQASKDFFGGVNPKVQAVNNLADNQQLMKGWGLNPNSPEAMQNASKGGLFINDIHNEALGLGNPIKTSDILSSNNIVNMNPTEQQIADNLGLIDKFGKMPENLTPMQANQFAQALNSELRDARFNLQSAKNAGSSQDIQAFKDQVNNLGKLYKQVQSKISSPEINQAIAQRTVTPAEKSLLEKQYGPQQANYIEQAVNNAKNTTDLTNAKLPFAQMNNLSDVALQDMQASATPRAVSRIKSALPTAPGAKLNKPADIIGGVGALTGHPYLLGLTGAAHLAQSPAALKGVSRVASTLSKMAPILGAAMATSPNLVAPPTNQQTNAQGTQPMAPTAQTIPGAGAGIFSSLPGMGGSPQLEAQAMQALTGMFDPYLMSTYAAPAAQEATAVQKAQTGAAMLPGLLQEFQQAGGAQGAIPGALSRLGAILTGGPAARYGGQAQQFAQQLSSATGIPVGELSAYLPEITQTPQVAQSNIQQLRNILASLGATNPQPMASPLAGL